MVISTKSVDRPRPELAVCRFCEAVLRWLSPGLLVLLAVIGQAGLGQEGEKTPHLCINIAGHTAPVRALAFTPDSNCLCTAGLDKVVRVWRIPGRHNPVPDSRAKAILVEELWTSQRTIRWEVARGLRGSVSRELLSGSLQRPASRLAHPLPNGRAHALD